MEKDPHPWPEDTVKRTFVVKKPYSAPRLVTYGSIAKLTEGGAMSGNDGTGTATMLMKCL